MRRRQFGKWLVGAVAAMATMCHPERSEGSVVSNADSSSRLNSIGTRNDKDGTERSAQNDKGGDRREIHAFRPCGVARIELVGADGTVKATRRLGFPVRMEYGDKLVVTLKD